MDSKFKLGDKVHIVLDPNTHNYLDRFITIFNSQDSSIIYTIREVLELPKGPLYLLESSLSLPLTNFSYTDYELVKAINPKYPTIFL